MQAKKERKGAAKPVGRPQFIAAIRYINGAKDIFYVSNADDLNDARSMVIADQIGAKTILLALRAVAPEKPPPDKNARN